MEPSTANKLIDFGIELAKLGGSVSIGALACFKIYFWYRGKHEIKSKTALDGLLEQFRTTVGELKVAGKETRAALEVTNGKMQQVHTDVEVLKAQVAPLVDTIPRMTGALEKLNSFYEKQAQGVGKTLEASTIAPGVTKIKESKS